jgi:phosphotriesterase-related protein
MHEHVLYDGRVFRRRFEAYLPEDPTVKPDEKLRLDNLGQLKHGFIQCWDAIQMEDVDLMAAELADFKSEGGSAVVDMSTPGLRIDPEKARQASEKSGIHIIGTTGLYARDSWPERFLTMDINEMEGYMDREVTDGIEGTRIKPGHIKIAIEENGCAPEIDALRAGARVAKRHGLSMTIHRGMLLGADAGLRIAEIVKEEGLDPARVVFAHADHLIVETNLQRLILHPENWGLNLDIARKLLRQGFNISFDCFGHYWDAESLGLLNVTDWQRLAGLVVLIREGFSRQIVLGTDTFVKLLLRRFGGESYCRLTGFVVPTLESVEIPADTIRHLTVENPARILAY